MNAVSRQRKQQCNEFGGPKKKKRKKLQNIQIRTNQRWRRKQYREREREIGEARKITVKWGRKSIYRDPANPKEITTPPPPKNAIKLRQSLRHCRIRFVFSSLGSARLGLVLAFLISSMFFTNFVFLFFFNYYYLNVCVWEREYSKK